MRSGLPKSYYIDRANGIYYDVTAEQIYHLDNKCALCGAYWKPLQVHHFLDQYKCEQDKKSIKIGKVITPNMWTPEFIKEHQKLYTVCEECHGKIERRSKKPVNGYIPRDFVYRNEEKKVNHATPPQAFVWKRGNSRF